MTFDDYQKAAQSTAIYPTDLKAIYPALGLAGEMGEVVELIKKMVRDEARILDDARRAKLQKEMGDVLWYMANLAADLGLSLSSIAEANIAKVTDRKERGVLHGDGDHR